VLWLEERTYLLDEIEHQGCEREHAVCGVRLCAASRSGFGNEPFKRRGNHWTTSARRAAVARMRSVLARRRSMEPSGDARRRCDVEVQHIFANSRFRIKRYGSLVLAICLDKDHAVAAPCRRCPFIQLLSSFR